MPVVIEVKIWFAREKKFAGLLFSDTSSFVICVFSEYIVPAITRVCCCNKSFFFFYIFLNIKANFYTFVLVYKNIFLISKTFNQYLKMTAVSFKLNLFVSVTKGT